MDTFESKSHSFVVKVWLEETDDDEQGHPKWRGHITHVTSSQRRYVDDLAGITKFISTYLEKMGVGVGEGWRGIRGWLQRRSA